MEEQTTEETMAEYTNRLWREQQAADALRSIPDKYRGGFDSFDPEIHRDYRSLFETAKRYAAGFQFETRHGLRLIGTAGSGKTHLLCGIVLAIAKRGFRVRLQNMVDLYIAWKSTFADDSEESESDLRHNLMKADLLALDDLGRDKSTEAFDLFVYWLINSRYNKCKPVLMTSNLGREGLEKRYGEAVVSRLYEMTESVGKFPQIDNRKRATK